MIALVAIGGALGALLRYLVDAVVTHRFGARLPWGTLTVNVVGSFVLGVVAALALRGAPAWLVPLLGSGLCGGLTTFSTFAHEAVALAARGHRGRAAAYLALSLALGLLAAGAGWTLAE